MSLEQLAVAKDRKDKLLSRVLKKRIELDFRDRSPHSDNAIHCCRHCAGLFSEKVCKRLARAEISFDFGTWDKRFLSSVIYPARCSTQ